MSSVEAGVGDVSTGLADRKVKVWDIATRVVHWLMVTAVAFSWWSAEFGHMAWHRYSGFCLLGLVAFRFYWGLFGSGTARFKSFMRGPRAVFRYARGLAQGQAPVSLGHSPMGGWSVAMLLGVMAIQIGTGLLAVDVDGLESGPLAYLVSFDAGRRAAALHDLSFNVLLGLICAHLVAIAFYLVRRRENLIGAMLHGYKLGDPGAAAGFAFASRRRLLLGAAVAVAVVAAVARGLRL